MQSKRLATYSDEKKATTKQQHSHRVASTLFTCYVMQCTRFTWYVVCCFFYKKKIAVPGPNRFPSRVHFFHFFLRYFRVFFSVFHIQISCMHLCNQHNGSLFLRFISFWKWFYRYGNQKWMRLSSAAKNKKKNCGHKIIMNI